MLLPYLNRSVSQNVEDSAEEAVIDISAKQTTVDNADSAGVDNADSPAEVSSASVSDKRVHFFL